jgi:inorganic pyrophosphatase
MFRLVLPESGDGAQPKIVASFRSSGMPRKREDQQRNGAGRSRPGIQALPTFNGDAVNVVIETPKGGRAKMKYDEKADVFRFEKLLPLGQAFPFDFGFLPSTIGGDGDPLDVLLIGEEPSPVGCVVLGKIIGVLEGKQTEKGRNERNDRILAIPLDGKSRKPMMPAPRVDKALEKGITDFFVSYNALQGKKFVPLGLHGRRRALRLVKNGIQQGKQGKAAGPRP